MKSTVMTFMVCVCALTLFSSKSIADEKLDTFKSIYSGEMDKIEAQHSSDMAQVGKAYLNYLDAELKKATDKGDLDGYSKIESEKKRFQAEKTIPADSPVQPLIDQAELKKNAALVDLSKKYVAGLNNHKIALMKAKDIGGARLVQEEIKKDEAVVAAASSKLPAVSTQGKPVKSEGDTKKGEDGLKILSAKYGARGNWFDLTEELNARIQNDWLSVPELHNLKGDPVPGGNKEIRVEYIYKGKKYQKALISNSIMLPLADPNEKRTNLEQVLLEKEAKSTKGLRIVSALYGARDIWIDLTDELNARIQNDRLSVTNVQNFKGDPAFGANKEIRVEYIYDGRLRSKIVVSSGIDLP